MMPRIALITTEPARPKDEDLAPLFAALQAQHVAPYLVDWDDPAVTWSRFDVAILRSPWDYMDRFDEFAARAAHIAQHTRLFNPLDLVRWNLDKHYLLDLQAANLSIVPSVFLEPDQDVEALPDAIRRSEFVVKPAIGAGSRDARRFSPHAHASALAHVRDLHARGRSVLLQPYLARVDHAGETALMYFNGVYSHAIRKGPLLRLDTSATTELFAPEAITARSPDTAERELADAAIEYLRQQHGDAPLYARVDLIRLDDGSPCILELELAEPSLFFAQGEGSAARLASAIVQRVKGA